MPLMLGVIAEDGKHINTSMIQRFSYDMRSTVALQSNDGSQYFLTRYSPYYLVRKHAFNGSTAAYKTLFYDSTSVFTTIPTYSTSTNPNDEIILSAQGIITKFNTSATRLFEKTINDQFALTPIILDSFIDSSQNSYVAGYINIGSGNYGIWIAKFDSSGSLLWSRSYTDSSGVTYNTAQATPVAKINVNSSGDVYLNFGTSQTQNGSNYWYLATVLAKWNSGGTFQWSKVIYPYSSSSNNFYQTVLQRPIIDSTGNVYVLILDMIFKLNSSGTFLAYLGRNSYISSGGVAAQLNIDASDNLYLAFIGTSSSTFYIFKYDTSFNLIWSRSLNLSGATTFSYLNIGNNYASLNINNYTGNYVLAFSDTTFGTTSASDSTIFAYLPLDGSKTQTQTDGTYTWTYASITAPTNTATAYTVNNVTATETLAPLGVSATSVVNRTGNSGANTSLVTINLI